MRHKLLLTAIVFFALCLRLYGLNWDQGQHLHPDERFLTMVAVASRIPLSIGEYLDPAHSPLNPYNNNFPFFIYGTLPLTLVKSIAVVLRADIYTLVPFIGRILSALCDIGTLLIVFGLVQLVEKRYRFSTSAKYIAAFLYAVAVLPIQQSHFFTVDSFATFFTTGTVYFALRFYYALKLRDAAVAAVFFGCALGTKLSSLYVGPLALVLLLFAPTQSKRFYGNILSLSIFVMVAFFVFRVSDPHAFFSGNVFDPRPSLQFVGNVKQLSNLSETSAWYPPGLQWIGKTPLLFPLKNIAMFGVGPVFFAATLAGYVVLIRRLVSEKFEGLLQRRDLLFTLGWIVAVLVYQGIQPVMSIRYFYLLYPYFALFAGVALSQVSQRWKIIVLLIICIWPVSFMTIYARPHSRVAASTWIYEHIPAGATIATEHWDDALPLTLSADRVSQNYTINELPVFDPDTPEKWRKMNEILSHSEYVIFSSNRGYGSIMPVSDRYPQMSAFYRDLFAGRSPFKKVVEFTSYPTFPLFYILPASQRGEHSTFFVFPDQWSDEAFTVYDHPKVMIFKKCENEC